MQASAGTHSFLGGQPARTHACTCTDFEATCQIDQGSPCCFYQKVKQEVKNLIPPLPDKYSSLGDINHCDIPLYMATAHVLGLLTISVIAGDRVRTLV